MPLNLIGSILGNQARKREATAAREHDLKMWLQQNKYNDPSNQMARLKKAGLNPNLIYGKGAAAGNVATAPQPAARAQMQNVQMPNIAKGYQEVQQIGLLREQLNNLKADTNLKNSHSFVNNQKEDELAMKNWLTATLQDGRRVGWGDAKTRRNPIQYIDLVQSGDLSNPALKARLDQLTREKYHTLIAENGVQESTYRKKLAIYGANNSDDLHVRLAAMYTIEQGYDLNTSRGLTVAANALTSIAQMFLKGKAITSGRRTGTNRLGKQRPTGIRNKRSHRANVNKGKLN